MGASDGFPVPHLEIDARKWAQIARERGYLSRFHRPLTPMLDRDEAQVALAIGSTLLTVRFEGHLHRRWREIGLFVNGETATFPLAHPSYVAIRDFPVLLLPHSPSTFRRYALLHSAQAALNEVTLRMNWLSPYGQDGVWRPGRTRLVPASELDIVDAQS